MAAPKQQKSASTVKAKKKRPSNTKVNWFTSRWRRLKPGKRAILIALAVFLAWWGSSYAIAYWYVQKHKSEPYTYGVTYISDYAKQFGLDDHETFHAIINDLGFRRFRLVSYWEDIEPVKGQYDFSNLDYQFDQIEQVDGKVTLAIGLRQPRWPECHAPAWAENTPKDFWYPELQKFLDAVVNRYKDRHALVSYQLENEYFLGVFGECQKFGTDRKRLVEEFNQVKKLDPNTPIILSLANNYFGIPTGNPRPDQVGISVYKRVYEGRIIKRYFEYPFPAWYYTWRSGLTEIFTGRSSMLHELQAEPWGPKPVEEMTIAEQSRSMDVSRLKERLDYAKRTGYRDVDLWGAEWWYWRKTKMNDPSLWNTVKDEMNNWRTHPEQY